MSITSDEVNFLVFRYLQESGFEHAAYTFGTECHIARSTINGGEVPPGALVRFLQKGLQYAEIEAHLNADGTETRCAEPFSLTAQHVCVAQGSIHNPGGGGGGGGGVGGDDHPDRKPGNSNPAADRQLQDQDQDAQQQQQPQSQSQQQPSSSQPSQQQQQLQQQQQQRQEQRQEQQQQPPAPSSATSNNNSQAGGVKAEKADALLDPAAIVPASAIEHLKGHTMEVFFCAWNPVQENVLASGSCDGTARVWRWNAASAGSSADLKHNGKQLTSLDWSPDGQTLATGCVDGQARLWTPQGALALTLTKHDAAIFAVKWSKRGDQVLSGSMDRTAVVWDAATGAAVQQFAHHTGPCLDVDWRNNHSFATCSADRTIHVCRVGEARPLKTFSGHGDEVNAIQFDPSGTLLASCSDDCSVKVWSLKQDAPVHDFTDHAKETYKILWSPTGPGSANPNKALRLASASYDHTVRVWDPFVGRGVATLAQHTESVFALAWSPDGDLLASGATDKTVHIWSLRDACVVRSLTVAGSVYEVAWSSNNRIAAATEHGIAVYDFRL